MCKYEKMRPRLHAHLLVYLEWIEQWYGKLELCPANCEYAWVIDNEWERMDFIPPGRPENRLDQYVMYFSGCSDAAKQENDECWGSESYWAKWKQQVEPKIASIWFEFMFNRTKLTTYYRTGISDGGCRSYCLVQRLKDQVSMTPQNCPTDSIVKMDVAKTILPTTPLMFPKNNFTRKGWPVSRRLRENDNVHAEILTCPISTSSSATNWPVTWIFSILKKEFSWTCGVGSSSTGSGTIATLSIFFFVILPDKSRKVIDEAAWLRRLILWVCQGLLVPFFLSSYKFNVPQEW